MNDKLSLNNIIDETTPIEIKDDNPNNKTSSNNEIIKNVNSKTSLESNSKDYGISSSNNKTSSKNFSFTEDSLKDKKSTANRQSLSSYQQDIKKKDENISNGRNQIKNEIASNQERNDDVNQNENSYNTNSTDSEVEVNFSVSDKKSKNDQEFELKISSIAFSSSSAKMKRVKYEVEQIKKYISRETKRLENEEIELSIDKRLLSEMALVASAPQCTIRRKLFKMGFL